MGQPKPNNLNMKQPHVPLTLPKGAVNVTAASWRTVRAAFAAGGLNWNMADKVMRQLEKMGAVWVISATPTAQATVARYLGYALTKVGLSSQRGSTISRAFALVGANGIQFTTPPTGIPASFKTPTA